MAREKQFVFSARTTEEGLRVLNELKGRLSMGWDEMVIDAVCTYYKLDRAAIALPKREKPAKETLESEQPAEVTPAKKRGGKKEKKNR